MFLRLPILQRISTIIHEHEGFAQLVWEHDKHENDRENSQQSEEHPKHATSPAALPLVGAPLVIPALMIHVREDGAQQTEKSEDVCAATQEREDGPASATP